MFLTFTIFQIEMDSNFKKMSKGQQGCKGGEILSLHYGFYTPYPPYASNNAITPC